MNVPVKTIVICATLLLMLIVGGNIVASTLVKLRAFEAGYCKTMLPGTSVSQWTLCAEHVGD